MAKLNDWEVDMLKFHVSNRIIDEIIEQEQVSGIEELIEMWGVRKVEQMYLIGRDMVFNIGFEQNIFDVLRYILYKNITFKKVFGVSIPDAVRR
tara:strand:+ start:1261 stop:1542 length:282 start_codon:yes stop_codon:yes gene_type:complete